MIPIADHDTPHENIPLGNVLMHGIPRAYAVLFFSNNPRLGWMLLAISMFTPIIGCIGLLGALSTALLAWWLGYDRTNIRNGFLLFNSLLISFSIAYLHQNYHFSAGMLLLYFTTSIVSGFFITVTLQTWMSSQWGLSAHSIPAVLTSYVVSLSVMLAYGLPYTIASSTPSWLELPMLPAMVRVIFQAFGAMIFQAHALPGVLVFLSLMMVSPLSITMATISISVGVFTLSMFGYAIEPSSMAWCSFNFLLCGIALGAGYYITSKSSVLLVCAGSTMCAFMAIALSVLLGTFRLPVSALPYNVVVLGTVYALRQRRTAGSLVPSPAPGMLPESAAQKILLDKKRFPHLAMPGLYLPFVGKRTVTQAFSGPLTHRGAWRYALDFETEVDGQKYVGQGINLEDFYSFGTAVLAPCNGWITAVVNHVVDNAPGGNNPDENWGNYVMIKSDIGYTVMLAHFKKGTVAVSLGQRVLVGTFISEVGNSGRSPVPHLHMQIQSTASLGSPTRAFCLKHFSLTSENGKKQQFLTSGIPEEQSVVESVLPLPLWSEIFYHWLPGLYRYQITDQHGDVQEETVTMDFDENGRYRFVSSLTDARLTAFVSDGVFYAIDFSGDHRSILSWMAAGIARVPCVDGDAVNWNDVVSSLPYQPSPQRWLKEVIEPFRGLYKVDYRYRMSATTDVLTVLAVLDGTEKQLPRNGAWSINSKLQAKRGITEIRVHLANQQAITAVLLDYRSET
jgi:urea transporter